MNIKPAPLGTIFSETDHPLAEKACMDNQIKRVRMGRDLLGNKYTEIKESNEIRYYDGANKYAIISRSLKVLWFERRNGEWYSVNK